MSNVHKTARILGAALVATALSPLASAASNPFGATVLDSGYAQVNHDKHAEGKCGEGKCGAKDEGKKDDKGTMEGKCGEGKCGAKSGSDDKGDASK